MASWIYVFGVLSLTSLVVIIASGSVLTLKGPVWVSGAVTFVVAVPCALTGYVSQQNFDAQWISTQAKDAMNAAGIGAFFNLTNFGQMYSDHVLMLPMAVAQIQLVREHGIVPPLPLTESQEVHHGS